MNGWKFPAMKWKVLSYERGLFGCGSHLTKRLREQLTLRWNFSKPTLADFESSLSIWHSIFSGWVCFLCRHVLKWAYADSVPQLHPTVRFMSDSPRTRRKRFLRGLLRKMWEAKKKKKKPETSVFDVGEENRWDSSLEAAAAKKRKSKNTEWFCLVFYPLVQDII